MRFYKPILWKSYFDKGWSQTSLIKYAIALFGITSNDVFTTMIWGAGYALFCVIVGTLWFKMGLTEAENEVANRHNLFVKEMRNGINRKV